jgi:hypothetical protein
LLNTKDDNIRYFYRLNRNTKYRVESTAALRVCEDFTDRFENVAMSGLNYHYFTPANDKRPPFYLNTRVYSCILLDNSLDFRWRVLELDGKPAPFNEDTDLSLQILKAGYCTILLNSFTCGKAATLTMKGGNTEEVYKFTDGQYDKRYRFAASLAAAHPDVVVVTHKWGRIHHHVDYSRFIKGNKLKLKDGIIIPRGVDEYGLKLIHTEANQDDEYDFSE